MKGFVPVTEAMYKDFIDKVSEKHPGRFEIVLYNEDEKTTIRDCEEMEEIAIRYRKPTPSWNIGYEVREDYYCECFPELVQQRF